MKLIKREITFDVSLSNGTANDEGNDGAIVWLDNGGRYDEREAFSVQEEDFIILRDLLNELIKARGLE